MEGLLEVLMAATDHGVPGDFNERHPGLRYEFADKPLMAAAYKNSEGKPTFAFGLHGEKEIFDGVNIFGELGVATGYSAAPLVPMGRAGVEFNNDLRIFAFPAVNKTGDFGPGLGVEYVLMRF